MIKYSTGCEELQKYLPGPNLYKGICATKCVCQICWISEAIQQVKMRQHYLNRFRFCICASLKNSSCSSVIAGIAVGTLLGTWTTGRNYSLHHIKSVCVHWQNSVQVTPRQLFWLTYSRHWLSNKSTQMSGQQLANTIQLLYFTEMQPENNGRTCLHPGRCQLFYTLSSIYS